MMIKGLPNKLLRADSHARECKSKMICTDIIIDPSESVSGSSSSQER